MNIFERVLKGLKVISEEDAEASDFLVCVRASKPAYFDDDETGTCSNCGEAVRFRPDAPKAPKRICMECFGAIAEADGAPLQ